jgi:integrase-like protein
MLLRSRLSSSLRVEGRRRVPTVPALPAMLVYRRDVGVMVPEEPPVLSPVEVLVGEYREWLINERGLAAMTVLRYETLARRFLMQRVLPVDELSVANLTGADVSRLLLGECEPVSVGSANGRFAELRSLLRLLLVRGFAAMAFAESVPSVAGWREHDPLPAPDDVGEALTRYLVFRGRRDLRRVFLTVPAPRRPIRTDLVGDVVQRLCKRAGVPHVGPNRLRHTLANELLAHGAALADISQVLRHSDLATAAIYAKVDLGRLRQVAQP